MEVPWELVRAIMHRSVGWRRNFEGLVGHGEPPTMGAHGSGEWLTDGKACYLSVAYALHMLKTGGPTCPKRPTDAALLAHIIDLWLEGWGFAAIARHLRHMRCRRLRGRNVYWTTSGVRHALDRGYCWLCDPERGKVLTQEEWREGILFIANAGDEDRGRHSSGAGAWLAAEYKYQGGYTE